MMQARVSFKRIEAFLSKAADDVRNEEAYGTVGCDRHCADLAKGEVKIENGTPWRILGVSQRGCFRVILR